VFTEQVLELHRGQGMEIYWRDNYSCPTEAEYRLMTCRKTGGLFNLAVRLMQLFSSSTQVEFPPNIYFVQRRLSQDLVFAADSFFVRIFFIFAGGWGITFIRFKNRMASFARFSFRGRRVFRAKIFTFAGGHGATFFS
jgi:hypothetical protein